MPVEVFPDGQDTIIRVTTATWMAELVPSIGGVLTRLKHQNSGVDLLRYPRSCLELWYKPEVWGMPLLFPPNSISRGRFHWNGREYQFPLNDMAKRNNMHGFFLHQHWQVTAQQETNDETMITMTTEHLEDSEEFKYFPHQFQAKLTYRFTSTQVIQELEFWNRDTVPMPLGFGFHTNFRQPFGAKDTVASKPFTFRMSTGNYYWGQGQFTERTIPKEWKPEDSFHQPQGQPLTGQKVWRHFPVKEIEVNGKPFNGAILDSPADRLRLYYEIDKQYGQWCIWNGNGDENFISIEPMSWMIDAPNLSLPPCISGLRGLDPDQHMKACCRLWLEPLE